MDSVTHVKSPPDSALADGVEDAQISALMAAAQKVDRRKVLTLIGHPHPAMPPVGDVLLLTPILLPEKMEVERRDVPWLHAGSGDHCEGAKLYRFNRRVVTVPCFFEPQPHGICCPSCHEIFGQIGDDDSFTIVKSRAPHTAARYESGAGVAFWRIPAIVESMAAFDKQVARVEATCKKYDFEQPEDWPPSFKDFVRDLFVTSGVVLPNSISFEGRRGRSYPRSGWDEALIAGLANELVATWLQLMWILTPDRFERAVDDLVENAEKWETSMINCVQAVYPLDPVFLGTSNAADFLCSGFAHAARWISALFERRDADSNADVPVFSWGPGVALATEWAVDIPGCKRPDRRASLRAQEPPSLPNDFLLSGSTMVDTQSTAGSDSMFSQSSSFTPSQSASTQPVEATAQDPPDHKGYFVVVDGPRKGIFPDPVMAASAAAGTSGGMRYAASREDAERILRQATPIPPVSESQSTVADAATTLEPEESAPSPPRDTARDSSSSDTALASMASTGTAPVKNTTVQKKHVAFASPALPWRNNGTGGSGRGGRGRGRGPRKNRAKNRARGGKKGAQRNRSASRNRIKPELLRRLDIAELNDDDAEFQNIVREGGSAIHRAVAASDFAYANFNRWYRASLKPGWYVASSVNGVRVARTFREAHESAAGDPAARFREFDTKKEADAYAFELQNPTPADTTCYVAFFEKGAPRICATFALAQSALSEGALDFKSFRDDTEAAEFIRTAKQWWAVLAGVRTGALDDSATISAMSNFPNPKIRGPFMSQRTAQKVFDHYSKYAPGSPERRSFAPMPTAPPIDLTAAPVTPPVPASAPQPGRIPVSSTTVPGRPSPNSDVLSTKEGVAVNSPSTEAWELAFQDGKRVVFAVRDGKGSGAVHFDCLKLDSRVSEPKVFFTGDLAENLAEAEEWAKFVVVTAQPPAAAAGSFAARLRRARGTAGAEAAATPVARPEPRKSGTGDTEGGRKITLVRDLTLGRADDQISVFFILRDGAIVLADEAAVPSHYHLYKLTEPGKQCYEAKRNEKGAKVEKILSPELMAFPKLCAWGNDVMKALIKDASSQSLETLKAVRALNDIGIEEYEVYKLAGDHALNYNLFRMRMYLQWQYAVEHGVVHPGGSALQQFRVAASKKAPKPEKKPTKTAAKKGGQASGRDTPPTGCWLCLSKTHYASDPRFHKSMADGEPACPTVEVCKKILDRIRGQTDLKQAEKQGAVKKVEEYWAKRKARAKNDASSSEEP